MFRIIGLAEELKQCPENIVIFGIGPESVALGQRLTETLAGKIDDYMTAISKELQG